MTNKFYVYELIDPRDGRVFYVGKGSGNRPYDHEREARAGRVSRKCDFIREILASGYAVQVAVVRRFAAEDAAYQFERSRIAEIGLANLTNISSGGKGGTRAPAPFRWTLRTFKKIIPSIVNVLRIMSAPGDGKLYACGDIEITQWAHKIIASIVRDLGREAVNNWLMAYQSGSMG